MVNLNYLFMIIKMSAHKEEEVPQKSTESLTESLQKLIQLLIEAIQSLYYTDSLNTANLKKSIKSVLTRFCEKKDIKQIDIFAILNSLRKIYPVSFEMKSITYSFDFLSTETTLTIGNSSNIIRINSNLIIERLESITSCLIPVEKDFIYLMYLRLYKKFIPIEFREKFDMSCDYPYEFYMNFYLQHGTTWEERRKEILQNCKNLVFRYCGIVSKNQYNYYRENFTPPESLVLFPNTNYIHELYHPDELQLRF